MSESEAITSAVEAQISSTLKDYPGYKSPEDRVVSDETLRGYCLRVMELFMQQMDSLEKYLAKNGPQDLAERARVLEQDIELLLDKVQIAPYSYSLFFTSYNLPPDVYDRIIQNDAAMISLAQQVEKILEPTLSVSTDFHALLDSLEDIILSLNEQIETRYAAIIEFEG